VLDGQRSTPAMSKAAARKTARAIVSARTVFFFRARDLAVILAAAART
jgi:hypothetical protein